MHSPWSAFCQAAPHACHRENTQKCFCCKDGFQNCCFQNLQASISGEANVSSLLWILVLPPPFPYLFTKEKKKQTGCVYFVHLYNWLQECHSTFWLQDYVKSLVLSVDAKLLCVDNACWFNMLPLVQAIDICWS